MHSRPALIVNVFILFHVQLVVIWETRIFVLGNIAQKSKRKRSEHFRPLGDAEHNDDFGGGDSSRTFFPVGLL